MADLVTDRDPALGYSINQDDVIVKQTNDNGTYEMTDEMDKDTGWAGVIGKGDNVDILPGN